MTFCFTSATLGTGCVGVGGGIDVGGGGPGGGSIFRKILVLFT